MRNCAILLLAVVAAQVSAETAWRWVDANGTIHYSDRPVPGAVEVQLPDTPARAATRPESTPSPRATRQSETTAAEPAADEQEAAGYTRLAIASPSQDETLWNIEGVLEVVVDVEPRLQDGHRVVLIFDGERRNPVAGPNSRYTIDAVYRGQHTVQAAILDAGNSTLMESRPVQFTVQQPSLLNPNRG
jgi:hypothetical protein